MGTGAGLLRLALGLVMLVTLTARGIITAESQEAPVARPKARRVTSRSDALVTPRPLKRPKARAVVQRWLPFARVGSVRLVHPADRVERVGFHEASDVATRELTALGSAVRPLVMPTRGRATGRRTAADIVVHPRAEIRAPVSGVVKRASHYTLYCKYTDAFAVISPDGHPEIEVKVLHFSGRRVRAGDRVVAGETVLGTHATKFPFPSQIDAFTGRPAWPHVHIEVSQIAVPSAVPQPGKSLTMGC